MRTNTAQHEGEAAPWGRRQRHQTQMPQMHTDGINHRNPRGYEPGTEVTVSGRLRAGEHAALVFSNEDLIGHNQCKPAGRHMASPGCSEA